MDTGQSAAQAAEGNTAVDSVEEIDIDDVEKLVSEQEANQTVAETTADQPPEQQPAAVTAPQEIPPAVVVENPSVSVLSVERTASTASAGAVDTSVPVTGRGAENDWVPPSEEEARKLRDQEQPRQVDRHGVATPWPITTDLSKLGDLGEGVVLYLYALRTLALSLLGLSICVVPALVLIIMGNVKALSDVTESPLEPLKVFTVGALFKDESTIIVKNGTTPLGCIGSNCHICAFSTCYDVESDWVAIVVANLDVFYTLLFLLVAQKLHQKLQAKVDEIDAAVHTAADWTVWVKGLPPRITEQEVKDYFSNHFGPVAKITLALTDGKVFQCFRKRGVLNEKIETAKASVAKKSTPKKKTKVEKLLQRRDKLDAKIEELRGKQSQNTVVGAFVSFENEDDIINCIMTMQKRFLHTRRLRKKNLLLEHDGTLYSPFVQKASEPSDLIWENMDASPRQQFFRRSFTSAISIAAVCVSFIVIATSKSFKEDIEGKQKACLEPAKQLECGLPLDPAIDEAQWETIVKQMEGNTTLATSCQTCACNSLQSTNVDLWARSVESPTFGLKGEFGDGGFCTEPANQLLTFYGLSIVSVIIVIVINLFVKQAMRALASIELHSSETTKQRSIAVKTAVLQVVNTVFVTLIVYARIDQIKDEVEKSGVSQGFPVLSGPFADFSPEWYKVVGVALLTAVITNMILPFVPLAVAPFKILLRRVQRKKQVTQRRLNELFRGPEFELAPRVGVTINTIFATFIFASGIPIMVPVAGITLFVTYAVDKWLLLRLFRKPPAYSGSIAYLIPACMPYAAVFHCLFGLWMYSARGESGQPVFPQPALSDQVATFTEDLLANVEEGSTEYELLQRYNVVARILNWVVFPMAILALLLLFTVVIWPLVQSFPPFLFVRKVIFKPCNNAKIHVQRENLPPYSLAREGNTLRGIPDYDKQSNPNFAHFFKS